MKERTISQRNLLGAFVGGVLGILAFGFLNALLLPVGVFAGVIGGWWYQEIWAYTADSYSTGVERTKAAWERVALIATPTLTLVRRLKERKFDPGPALRVMGIFFFPLLWLLRRPMAFALWLQHPVARAYMVRVFATLTYYGLNALWVVPTMVWLCRTYAPLDHSPTWMVPPLMLGILFTFVAGMSVLMTPMMFIAEGGDTTAMQMRLFYRTWTRYASQGSIGFFFTELFRIFQAGFTMTAMMTGGLAWFMGLGGIFLVVVGTISAAVGFVKGVYQVSTRAGHWLCFGTTLTTTAISGVVFHSSFGDIRILWFVALLTGLFSAGATEGLRRGFVLFFKTNRSARAIALVPLGKQLQPGGSLFWRTSTSVGDWFIGFLPMHPQAA
ncbi:MAG: hypothetical protein JWL82_501 [Parcubacteria group bacterium]|nr:hypothetical protein [Parcubacteria group bacterium]